MKLNFHHWVAHFERSLANPIVLPAQPVNYLNTEELEAIKKSIRQFQAGENSDGGTFRRTVAQFLSRQALKTGDEDRSYAEAIALFVKEEQGHAAMLGSFMKGQGISLQEKHWPDAVFRRLRHFGGVEVMISVLLTAELIALIYYEALHDATNCPDLRQICRRILEDEKHHIRFQTEFLGKKTAGRSFIVAAPVLLLRTFLIIGTVGIVWIEHKKTLRRGGFVLPAFFHAVMLAFYKAQGKILYWQKSTEVVAGGKQKSLANGRKTEGLKGRKTAWSKGNKQPITIQYFPKSNVIQ